MIWPILIAAVVFAVSLWRLRYGAALIVLILPSYLIRTTVHGIPTTALELSIYAAVVAMVIDMVRRKNVFRPSNIPKPWVGIFIIWAAAWIAATLSSTDRTASLGALKAWLIDPNLLGVVILYCYRTAADKLFLAKSVILSGAVVALAGFVQMVAFRSTLQDGRLSSFFHPVANYAAMYLEPIFIIGAALLIYKTLRGWLWWVLMMIIAGALLLTVSFAGYLACAAGIIAIWFWLPKGQLKKRLGLSALAVVIIAGVVIPQTKYFSEHFKTTDRSSGLVRSQIWVTSWFLIKQKPLLGIGPNTFEASYRLEVPKHYWPPLEWLVAQPHNLYLALWLETGIVGALAFAAFIFYWFRKTWAGMKIDDEGSRALSLACVAAIVAILIHGLFDTPYFKNDLAVEFVLIVILPWLGRQNLSSKAL